MVLAEFVAKYNGGLWDFDGHYGDQCADLVNFYNRDVLGAPQFPGANAVNFYGELTDWFDWIPNQPDNFPSAGDVVVWDGTFGNGNGHTAIALPGANRNAFNSLDQNWGPMVTHTVGHTYRGVIGWGRPKGTDMLTDAQAKQLDEIHNGAINASAYFPRIEATLSRLEAILTRLENALKGA